MTESFLDRLGAQLLAAERTLVTDGRAAARRRRWTTPRTAAVAIAGLAIAASAVAATTPWHPILGRPEVHDAPAGTSSSPVPTDANAQLAVLRRPQTDRDRGPITEKLLRSIGQQFQGVRLGSVRLVTLSPGHHALVLSAEGVGQLPGVTKGTSNPVCFVSNVGSSCGGARSLLTGGIVMTAGPSVRGLVPDGVAKVVLRFAGGQTVGVDVHDNVFSISRTPTAGFTVQWLDTNGSPIGPPKTK
jgi:hypothetical protein